MKILVTGTAGFIGYSLSKKLESGNTVFGLDNHNDYYDVNLKEARVEILKKYNDYKHHIVSLEDMKSLQEIFKNFIPMLL